MDTMENNNNNYQNNTRKKNRNQLIHSSKHRNESETYKTEESVGDTDLSDGGNEGYAQKDDAISLRKVSGRLGRDYKIRVDSMMKAPPSLHSGDVTENSDSKATDSSSDKSTAEDHFSVQAKLSSKVQLSYSLINTRALNKHSPTYELEKFEKRSLIIFNHKEIEGYEEPRSGTEKDVESLTKTFQNFGFEVTTHNDLTKEKLFNTLKTFSEKDFTDYGCVAVAVLTHGSNDGLLRAKDQPYRETEIIDHFKDRRKSTLVTKPKLIIIQACRGSEIKPGVRVESRIYTDLSENLDLYILPVESDLLIFHSSYVGSTSHRHVDTGSWFIQALCKNINSLASSHDLESIFVEVKREVAIDKERGDYNKITKQNEVYKQMPVVTSTLIRKLYLRKFREEVKQDTFVDQLSQPNGFIGTSQSRHEFLDTGSTRTTPILANDGPCLCSVDHFTYMKTCLKYFVEEHPREGTAKSILGIANACKDGDNLNVIDETCKAMSKHLRKKARSKEYYKFLHFYKHSQ